AVDADHDNDKDPYGKLWLDSYTELARLYDVTVIGVSNVGPITNGPWRGRKVIGCSLAIGSGGKVLARGPYGEGAAALIPVEVKLRPQIGKGTGIASVLEERNYRGP